MMIWTAFRHPAAGCRGGPTGRPCRLPFVTVVLSILALAGCGIQSRPPRPALSVPSFTGTVRAACGPTDARALQVDLVPEHGGAVETVSIGLWGAAPPDAPIVKSFTILEGGEGRWCPRGRGCLQASRGTIWFERVSQTGSISGRFRLETSSGDLLEGVFRVHKDTQAAPICG